MTATIRAVLGVLIWMMFASACLAQDALPGQEGPRAAPTTRVEAEQLQPIDWSPSFDAAKATDKYLARVSGEARARSDAYFESGYWLQLADLAYGLVVAALLLSLGLSAHIRDWATERTRSRSGQVLIYVAVYMVIVTVATLPLTWYESFFREHAYGLSEQSLASWFGDFAIAFAKSFVAALIFLPVLYAVIRAAREVWWIWGGGVAIVFLALYLMINPVFIAPLTNHYIPLPDSPLKSEILSMARANGIQADNVWTFDASRQTSRISANVSGFLGTTRISLNDNLLKQGTHDEVLAVLGHEMGHYVMDHVTRELLLMGLVIIAAFGFANWGFRQATDLFGGQWQVRRLDDIAGLPLLGALVSVFFFLATPVTNSITRTMERQADIFGVNAVRKPDAFATVALKLSSYRKLDPGPVEEIVFFDHPSGRARIRTMMEWKAAHIGDTDLRGTENVP